MQTDKKIGNYFYNTKYLIGQGSFASVYKAHHEADYKKQVAIKVIDKKSIVNIKNGFNNLHHEVQIMKKMKHQNIVQFLDVFQSQRYIYIVTQLCEIDLKGYLQNAGKLTEDIACDFLEQIVKGMHYLHQHKIAHRDLKPANILIKNGQCKISDFGFAKNLTSENTLLKSIVGTPLYMSPQLLQRTTYTSKSQIWSLGLIFYEMLHAKIPWRAKNQLQLLNNIYSQKIIFNKNVSANVRQFINSCLIVDEKKRIGWGQVWQMNLFKKDVIESVSIDKIDENSSFISNKENRSFQEIQKGQIKINLKQPSSRRLQWICLTPKAQQSKEQPLQFKKTSNLTPRSTNRLRQVIALTPNHKNKQTKEETSQQKLHFKRRNNNQTVLLEHGQKWE